MKRILFLTLTVATVALLGGCAGMADYGHGNRDPSQSDSNNYDHQDSNPGGY
jgi:hypothetical protein